MWVSHVQRASVGTVFSPRVKRAVFGDDSRTQMG